MKLWSQGYHFHRNLRITQWTHWFSVKPLPDMNLMKRMVLMTGQRHNRVIHIYLRQANRAVRRLIFILHLQLVNHWVVNLSPNISSDHSFVYSQVPSLLIQFSAPKTSTSEYSVRVDDDALESSNSKDE